MKNYQSVNPMPESKTARGLFAVLVYCLVGLGSGCVALLLVEAITSVLGFDRANYPDLNYGYIEGILIGFLGGPLGACFAYWTWKGKL